ncbi:hypothetical protein KY309_02685 [Candidatus Woesearchaeota archaeon]|nr:hypothetical protein [Candidatus Woesearchaeota archaeon]MBW3016491.1 hypothetical protein [Candidatus Woesearchaeota archaeon]
MKWVIIFLLLSSVVVANDVISNGNITLLALMERDGVKSGTVAHLFLELRPGSERVYLETYPMTKVTTQASLRFAQQVACKEVNVDCSKYDFLYTIRAMPGIVGGPSAGSAATFLTAAMLLNKSIPDDLAMTGTINSGGIIGPVGGLKYKVEAAANNSVKTVFLPPGTKEFKEDNKTVDLIDYGNELNLTVLEMPTLGDALEYALGVPHVVYNDSLEIESRYQRIMREVSEDLCMRTADYFSVPSKANLTQAKNFTERAALEQEKGAYYAAASYCFRANVDYKREWYEEQNFTKEQLVEKTELLKQEARKVRESFESKNISSLGDVQTFMAVLERVGEAEDSLVKISELLEKNRTDVAPEVGYAEERLFSGITWARFFDGSPGVITVDEDSLKSVCIAKASEAEERYNYVKSMIPEALDSTRADLDKAYSLMEEGEYIMCLYTAAKAKSEADVVLGLLGVEENRFDDVIDLKLSVARQALIKAQKKGFFPIIAYSYYEYAISLRDFDRVSSLLFAEYALELSNLDIYFQEKLPEVPVSEPFVIPPEVYIFLIGFGVGGLFMLLLTRRKTVVKKGRKRRSSRR